MRQSNALFRLNTFIKKEEESLGKYWQRENKNEKSAKTWDAKNLELSDIQNEFIVEMDVVDSNELINRALLEQIDREVEYLKTSQPEVSFLMVKLRVNNKDGHPVYLDLENYGTI